MQIILDNISKKFGNQSIFRKLSTEFNSGESWAITGRNGSGKSTLLQVIMGYITPTKGGVSFYNDLNTKVDKESVYQYIGFSAPYIDLHQELTLKETIDFHSVFKNTIAGMDTKELIGKTGLSAHQDKQVKYFSSGMLQRLKLSLSLLFENPIIFLDEPTTNFDTNAISWYHEMIDTYCKDKLIIVASNQRHEYEFCQKELNIHEWKRE